MAGPSLVDNRDLQPGPGEWLDVMADPMLAQSAADRHQNAAYELVVEGESYRKRQKPGLVQEEVSAEEEDVV